MLATYFLASTPLLAQAQQAASPVPAGQRLAIAVLESAIFLALIGTIAWGVALIRRKGSSWWQATTSPIALFLAFVLAATSAAGMRSGNNAGETTAGPSPPVVSKQHQPL